MAAIREKLLGPDHAEIAALLERYAEMLRATGRKTEAQNARQRAALIRTRLKTENPQI